ncbi:hypothetical protein ACN47E_002156 [Coniothyrium glycines]
MIHTYQAICKDDLIGLDVGQPDNGERFPVAAIPLRIDIDRKDKRKHVIEDELLEGQEDGVTNSREDGINDGKTNERPLPQHKNGQREDTTHAIGVGRRPLVL